MKEKNMNKGITIVALVITIVLMLILVTITVNVAINGGLFNYAGKAKQDTEIASEKETVQKATIIAETTSKTGRITVTGMEKAIKNITDGSNTTIMEDVETIVVKFNNSNRYYTVDNKGNVAGPIETINDENSGDLSKGGAYLGTEESPYVINCIEDLVEFSSNYATYETSFVILARTLDFKSIFSYNDYSTTKYGDLNGDGTEENIKTELTKQGDDRVGFTPIASFKGTFDGQGYKICNLYENRGENPAGLFEFAQGQEMSIKNLGLENITLIGSTNIGGIAARIKFGTISNCYVEGVSTIRAEQNSYIGLIIGTAEYSPTYIKNCSSKGVLELDASEGYFGGILGFSNAGPSVYGCSNVMEINSNISAGGIIGLSYGTGMEECFHVGNVSGGTYAAGIAAYEGWGGAEIKNCYNIGDITSSYFNAGIVSGFGAKIYNCYSIGVINRKKAMIAYNYSGKPMLNCFARRGDCDSYADDVVLTEAQVLSIMGGSNGYKCEVLFDDELKEEAMITKLNNLVYADDEGTITETEQNVWKMDTEGINNGYPIFIWQ